MKSNIASAGKMLSSLICASFLAVLLISSCSEDETIRPAPTAETAGWKIDESEPTGKINDPILGDPSMSESLLYPYMPSGSMIYFAHGSCEGGCPVYTVSVTSEGLVRYTGYRNVGTIGRYSYLAGREVAQLLAEKLVDAGFLTLNNQYPYLANAPMHVTGLNLDKGEPKIIQDYGYRVPTALVETRMTIERTLGIDKLIRTLPGDVESPVSVTGGR